jgi:predicted DNA-binding transcriptional regulator AlpA
MQFYNHTWVRTSEMAEFAGVGKSTLRRMAQEKQFNDAAVRLKPRKSGYEYRWNVSKTLQALEDQLIPIS